MKIYRSLQWFFCTPIKRYIPIGAYICRWEHVTKIVINDAPESDDLFHILVTGVEYDKPECVTWFWKIEPVLPAIRNEHFRYVGFISEDAYGNLKGPQGPFGPDGLQGSQGPFGGPPGPQGIQGPIGPQNPTELYATTYNATPKEMLTVGLGRITIGSYKNMTFNLLVTAIDGSFYRGKAWRIGGGIKRLNLVSSTVLLPAPVVDVLGADAGTQGWSATVAADTLNGALSIMANGVVGFGINWKCAVQVVTVDAGGE